MSKSTTANKTAPKAAAAPQATAATGASGSAGSPAPAPTGQAASSTAESLLNIGAIIQRNMIDHTTGQNVARTSGQADVEAQESPAETDATPDQEPAEPHNADSTESDDTDSHTPETDTPEAADAAESGDDTEERDDAAPEKRGMRKRIDKLTARNSALEDRIRELEEKLQGQGSAPSAEQEGEEPSARRAPANPANPLGNVTNLAELQQREAEANSIIDWTDQQMITLRRNPVAVENALKQLNLLPADSDGAEREEIEATLLSLRSNAERTLRVHVPQRREYLAAAEHFDAKARQEFPWWSDKKAPEYQLAQRVLAEWGPGVKSNPNWRYVVGVHVLGLKALESQRGRNGKPGAKGTSPLGNVARVPAPRVPGLSANPVHHRTAPDPLASAMARARKGDPNAARDYLTAAVQAA